MSEKIQENALYESEKTMEVFEKIWEIMSSDDEPTNDELENALNW